MKKILFIFSLLLTGSLHLAAQNVVSGKVVDPKGKPILGAKVEAVGGSESVITELDGTFVIETQQPVRMLKARYGGMQAGAQKAKNDMVIKMRSTNWWNEKPEKYQWLVGAQLAFPQGEWEDIKPSYGFMLGGVKKWGWYVKGVFNIVPDCVVTECEGYYGSYDNYWHTGKKKTSYWSTVGGFIVRLGCPIYFNMGVGYSSRTVGLELINDKYMKIV